jgi:hypothetical protein
MKSDWLRGALSGCVATVPMTAAMLAWHRRLPLPERYPLPPRQITMNVARRLGIKGQLGPRQKTAATLALQILTPATDHPKRRNALMVASHLVWGSVTGCLVRSANGSEDRS